MSLWLYMLTSIPGFMIKELPYVYIGSSRTFLFSFHYSSNFISPIN